MPTDNAYLIHSRRYSDSRKILELLTENHGVISGMFRVPKKNRHLASVEPFTPLFIQWQGKNALKTVVSIEHAGQNKKLLGNALYGSFYLNEVLSRVLVKDDSTTDVFSIYQSALNAFDALSRHENAQQGIALSDIERVLRSFEFDLIDQLGFQIDFNYDIYGHVISSGKDHFYSVALDEGFFPITSVEAYVAANTQNNITRLKSIFYLTGESILAIQQRDFSQNQVLKEAKYLSRLFLKPLLGNAPLKSREMFAKK